jgi:hypothetical protein
MKRLHRVTVLVAAVGLLGASFGVAQAYEAPPHSHLMLTGVQLDETGDWPISIRKCHPLANGRALPTHAHHETVHTGRAGEALWDAGNAVVPVFLGENGTPWHDCASLMEFFFGEG